MSNKASRESLSELSKDKLKEKCRSERQKVSGNKQQLIDRLLDVEEHPTLKREASGLVGSNAAKVEKVEKVVDVEEHTSRKRKAPSGLVGGNPEKAVNKLLMEAGLTEAECKKLSKCARLAIHRGHIVFTGKAEELDAQAIIKKKGREKAKPLIVKCIINCRSAIKPTLRDLLNQSDNGGGDDEGEGAAAKCAGEECGGTYVALMCQGIFGSAPGKAIHHCGDCKGLGKCLGDSRELHCLECGHHYWGAENCYSDTCRRRRRKERKKERQAMKQTNGDSETDDCGSDDSGSDDGFGWMDR